MLTVKALITLPPEILRQILTNAHPTAVICASLTCRRLYTIYLSLPDTQPKPSLRLTTGERNKMPASHRALYELTTRLMGKEYAFCYTEMKFGLGKDMGKMDNRCWCITCYRLRLRAKTSEAQMELWEFDHERGCSCKGVWPDYIRR